MSVAKRIYDLIATRQAISVPALVIATGMTEANVRSNIYFLRVTERIKRNHPSYPATYSAIALSEPPKVYRARQPKGVNPKSIPILSARAVNSVFALGAE